MTRHCFYTLFLYCCALLAGACTSEDEKATLSISVLQTEVLPVSSDIIFLTLEANGPWTAETDQPWCRVEPPAGEAGEYSLAFVCEENTSYDERRAVVTITSADDAKQVELVQHQTDAVLADVSDRTMPSSGGNFTLEMDANVEVDVTISQGSESEDEWLTLESVTEPTKALSKRVYTFNVKPSELTYKRQGYVTFRPKSQQELQPMFLHVTQEQKDFIRLDEQPEVVDVLGNNWLQLNIYTNHTLVEMSKPDWIASVTLDCYGQLPTSQVAPECRYVATVEVLPNKYGRERSGRIVFVGGDAELAVDISQESSCFPTEGLTVDLGVDAVWAGWNLGAESPSDYGNLYDRQDDAPKDWATYTWGSPWRLPSSKDFSDLNYKCISKRTYCNGVFGLSYTSPTNGNCIFLPAAGCRMNDELIGQGESVYVWGSAAWSYDRFEYLYSGLYVNYPPDSPEAEVWPGPREKAMSVRPVYSK